VRYINKPLKYVFVLFVAMMLIAPAGAVSTSAPCYKSGYSAGYNLGYSKGVTKGHSDCVSYGIKSVLVKIPTPSVSARWGSCYITGYKAGFKAGFINGYNKNRFACLKR
jgi:hypothetical protein